MKTYTELEIIAQERQKQINDMNVQLEGYEALKLEYKRLKRQLEKQRKSNRGKQAILQEYKDKYGMIRGIK